MVLISLPVDLLLLIVKNLPCGSLSNLSLTNKFFLSLVNSERLWKMKVTEEFGLELLPVQTPSHRRVYFDFLSYCRKREIGVLYIKKGEGMLFSFLRETSGRGYRLCSSLPRTTKGYRNRIIMTMSSPFSLRVNGGIRGYLYVPDIEIIVDHNSCDMEKDGSLPYCLTTRSTDPTVPLPQYIEDITGWYDMMYQRGYREYNIDTMFPQEMVRSYPQFFRPLVEFNQVLIGGFPIRFL